MQSDPKAAVEASEMQLLCGVSDSETKDDNSAAADGEDDALPSSVFAQPLFMDGLPADFSTHPTLAALASLMEEDADQDHDDCIARVDRRESFDKSSFPKHGDIEILNSGGGKTKRVRGRNVRSRQSAPYPKPSTAGGPTKGTKSTVAEASLFLKMWKI